MKETTETLRRSNEQLEEFAYVASHDLQEPLRMVGSYTMLLAKRYKGRLDADADKFIDYAVSGSKRMQLLIQDLLAYSRVSAAQLPFQIVSTQEVLRHVLETLELAIKEQRAVVTWDALPEIYGEPVQLTQLFQNLIGNAIKFHGSAPPEVHIAATHGEKEWIFSVKDNGIGISPEYSERIFAIFQRLHSRDRYEGTGIGLAVCKKIVERHGGRIWVESGERPESGSAGESGQKQASGGSEDGWSPGGGATFYLTVPDHKR